MLQVIIGRFQTNNLHKGHIKLIQEAKREGKNILILIGVTAATGTDKNPLSFEVRKHLFDQHLSVAIIKPLHDMPSDKDWSDQIDNTIEDLGFKEAIIWGGRDNSIEDYYSGKHQIKTIGSMGKHSATSIRKEIAKEPINCPNFRAGIIHHIENRYPIVYSTVDVIIYKTVERGNGWEKIHILDSILMGKKGDKFMLIGGFVDTTDVDLNHAATRELLEETGLVNFKLKYEFSHKVNDSRYLATKDCIMTHLFSGRSEDGKLPDQSKIQDKEFTEFKWMPANESSLEEIAEAHKPLFLTFINANR